MKKIKHVLAIGVAALVAMASAVPLAEAGGHGFGGGGFGGHGFGGGGFGSHGFGGGGFGSHGFSGHAFGGSARGFAVGPRGGFAFRGPRGGLAFSGPRGGRAFVGPRGGVFVNRNFGHRHFVNFNHRHFNHRRFVAVGFFPGFYGLWLLRRRLQLALSQCRCDRQSILVEPVSVLYRLLRLTTVVSVSHVDLKIDRAMKTPRSLAGETEVSLTRAMAARR